MIVSDYYRLLGLSEDCSLDDLKRAYRMTARIYHPDLNHSPDAPAIFIRATEAYEFLRNYIQLKSRPNANTEYIRQWDTFRRQQTQARADYYSRIRYREYTKSNTYRTTRLFDGTIIIYGLVISLLIVFLDIYSYSKSMEMAIREEDEPSLIFMIILLLLGMSFFAFAFMQLISFLKKSKAK